MNEVYTQDWTQKWAVYSPDKIAVKEYESGRTLTYGELNRLANRLAHHLTHELELVKGERIAVLAENCLEYIILFAAVQKTGLILVPLNYRLASAEIDYLLQNAEPKMVVGEQKYQATLAATKAFHQVSIQWSIEELRVFCDKEQWKKEDHGFPIIPVSADDPVFILYTSGTTGFPKGALYTHQMLFWNSINTSMSLLINTESRTINCMPPFHTGGWNVLTTPFLHHGGYTCLMKKFDPAAVLQLLQAESATIFMGVPTMLKMIADEAAFDQADFSSLYYIIVGGEPMPVPLIEQWDEKGVAIRQGFGMTEVGPNLTSLHQDDAIRKKGSIGRPNFYVQIRIVDEKGADVPTGQSGELLLKGPMVTPGYWRNEAATQKALQDGWFHSGDMLVQDEEGYLFVVDRIKNMFISGGENVYPAQIERILVQHECISEAAVIGVRDEKWGEVGQAFVVKKAEVTAEEVIGFCKEQLAKFKVPKYVVFVEELPKNDTGKIDRKKLKTERE